MLKIIESKTLNNEYHTQSRLKRIFDQKDNVTAVIGLKSLHSSKANCKLLRLFVLLMIGCKEERSPIE